MTGISHLQFHKLIQASLDGTPGEEEHRLLEAHLATCPSCRQYAADLGALQGNLSRLMKKRWQAGFDPDPRILQNIQLRSRMIAMRRWVFRIAAGVVVIGIFIFVFSGVLSGLENRSSLHSAAGLPVQETATPASDNTSVACQTVQYTVQANDTLSSIATKFGVPVEAIKAGNGFANDTLKPGMQLVIPLCMRTGTPNQSSNNSTLLFSMEYVVQSGDTCSSIAVLFNVSLSALIQQNNLNVTCSDLSVGQILKIPGSIGIDVTSNAFPITGPGECKSVQVKEQGIANFVWPTFKHYLSGSDYDPQNYHFGLDIAADLGEPILAADAGTVIYAGWNDWGYGNLVVLDHGNGWQTLYAHLDGIKVSCGQSVTQGALIGLAGLTGHATSPHLHFEMILNGAHVNPWTILPKP